MTRKTILILFLILALGLSACGGAAMQPAETSAPEETAAATPSSAPTPTPTAAPTESPAATPDNSPTTAPRNPASASDLTPTPAPDAALPVSVMVMNGPTGFGMAKLVHDAANGTAALNYSVSVESDASNVTAALINDSVDIAVLPTNAAATVYNKTQGQVKVAADVVLGNLYLVQNTGKVTIGSVSDLAGKTVYAPAQNPTFIFNYLARENGLNIEADNTYAQPADLRTALVAGQVDLAVLPEPMATIAMANNDKLSIALNLDELWEDATGSNIVLGCVAVRSAFAEAHPTELAVFLNEYKESVLYLVRNIPETAQMIADTGIFAQAAVAEKAIPRCGLCFNTGNYMKYELEPYLAALYDVAPQSIGGALPEDDFYYGAQ